MLQWENKQQTFSESFKQIASDIENTGSDFFVRYLKTKKIDGYYWSKNFKAWEYPIAVEYINKFEHLKNRKLKIMDFGCGVTPLAQYLSERGHEVWGVDYQFGGHLKIPTIEMLEREYPKVNYYIGDVNDLLEDDFDVVFSCSVLEHIHPTDVLISILDVLKSKLGEGGKMFHVADYYMNKKNIDYYKVLTHLNVDFDPLLCPNSDSFDLGLVKNDFSGIEGAASRIIFGDN